MSGRSFWFAAFILVAVASHLAYVLFSGRVNGRDLFEDVASIAGPNHLVVLDEKQSSRLAIESDMRFVNGVCAFDLTHGNVVVNGVMPDNYWSMTVYAPQGDVIYTLNDRQANIDDLTFNITREDQSGAGSFLQSPASKVLDRVEVLSAQKTGIVVFRALTKGHKERPKISDIMSQSSCN